MKNEYRAERAIIMAAGQGKRLQPLTFSTPKPLIRVNGERMIDTAIKGLRANGINEIYIVVGYLKEQFAVLTEEYQGIELIENPYYDTCNNISSLYVAREHLDNCMILDGDQIIYDTSVLDPRYTVSGYNAVWTDRETDEWLLDVQDGVIKSCSRTGGAHGWQLFSISRWSSEDGKKLRKHLETEFEIKKNRQIYWDDVAMFVYPQEYSLGIHEMKMGDVKEIDSLEELAEVDPEYKETC